LWQEDDFRKGGMISRVGEEIGCGWTVERLAMTLVNKNKDVARSG
jgi:hypothetical protein